MALDLVRLYTYYFPLRKGKYRVMNGALWLAGCPGGEVVRCSTADGRVFQVEISSSPGMYDTVYFLGEYERCVTKIITLLVRPGDRCLDVGANYGWFTTLLSTLCGPGGEVHAFEPVPRTFEILKKNFELAGRRGNIHLNNAAVADVPGEAVLHIFAGLPHGHTSMSDMGRSDYSTVRCPLITLDAYLRERKRKEVQFIKCDVEGAELKVLMGAQSLFNQEAPPIWIIEMVKETSVEFTFKINDLLVYMRDRAAYDFFLIDEARSAILPLTEFTDEDLGANVLCVPAKHYRDRITTLGSILGGPTEDL